MNANEVIGRVFRNRANPSETFRVHDWAMAGKQIVLVGVRGTCCTAKRSTMLWSVLERGWELVE